VNAHPRRSWSFATTTNEAFQYYAVFLVLLAICATLSVLSSVFTTIDNIGNVSEQVSVVGVTAMGMTLLLVSGNIDLSVGGQVALIGVVVALAANGVNTPAGIVVGVLVGLILGAVNGLIVTRLGVNSLVATLGSGLAFGGLAFLLSGSQPIVLTDRNLQDLMNLRLIRVPVPAYLFAIVIAATAWFLHSTVGGRELFAVGASPEAARYAGLRVERVRFIPFVIMGGLCALASLILTALLNTADPGAGARLPLDVIAATVVGGVSIAGGRGTVFMAVVGVLLIGVVSNGFNLLGFDPNYQSIFSGLIIIVAVAVDSALQKRAVRVTPLAAEDADASGAQPISETLIPDTSRVDHSSA
jgi:ribose/xylose/arabinose/galactoside ABC-type transport system permease subunit